MARDEVDNGYPPTNAEAYDWLESARCSHAAKTPIPYCDCNQTATSPGACTERWRSSDWYSAPQVAGIPRIPVYYIPCCCSCCGCAHHCPCSICYANCISRHSAGCRHGQQFRIQYAQRANGTDHQDIANSVVTTTELPNER